MNQMGINALETRQAKTGNILVKLKCAKHGSEKQEKRLIRNSTAEFLIFTGQAGEQSIEARYEDETIWLSQKLMAALFDVGINIINYHLKEVYESGEVRPKASIRKFRIVQQEGSRQVARDVDFYNLDAIISVGYRVNSVRATQFRQWATQVLREFAIKGYVLDNKRMENGAFLGEDYFERLLEEIREIRLSERKFYQKITDTISTTREDLEVTKAGIQGGLVLETKSTEAPQAKTLPDILAFLQRETELTRHTLVRILKASGRLQDFPVNAQSFMTEVARHINRTLHGMIVDGIKYERIAGQEYEMRLFEEEEVESYLANLYAVQSKNKTLFDYIPYDSEVEREFARQLDGMEKVRLFVKLPRWFVVKTPIGDYNPDWAIVAEQDNKVYLVRETKSSLDDDKRRTSENQKIKCGKKHFQTLGVDFKTVTNAAEALATAKA